MSRPQEVDLVFIIFFSYFHSRFDLISYFLFIELRVRDDGHRSQGKGAKGVMSYDMYTTC